MNNSFAFLASCFHVVTQEITVKSKFAKKYDCPRKNVKIVDGEIGGRGDNYKVVGCGVSAVYKGTKEIYSSAEERSED